MYLHVFVEGGVLVKDQALDKPAGVKDWISRGEKGLQEHLLFSRPVRVEIKLTSQEDNTHTHLPLTSRTQIYTAFSSRTGLITNPEEPLKGLMVPLCRCDLMWPKGADNEPVLMVTPSLLTTVVMWNIFWFDQNGKSTVGQDHFFISEYADFFHSTK